VRTFVTGEVPCGECHLCCCNELVVLYPQDEPTRYSLEKHPFLPGKHVIAHKENKECVYLNEQGCSIWEDRPQLCKEFDCRVMAAKFKWGQAQKMRIIDTWERGRELLKEIPQDADLRAGHR